jgi:anti-sigma28 factor (negative regulator of flagellin synthesis)
MKHIKLFENFSDPDMKNMLDEGVIQWTPEKIRQAINDGDYVSRVDLGSKNPGLYSAAYRNNMLDEFFDRLVRKWTSPEKVRQAIADGNYVNRLDLARKDRSLYNAAQKHKILDEFFDNYTKTPGKIPAERTEWSTEKIREQIIAGDYKSKFDLMTRNYNLYNAALKYGVLYEFFDKSGDKIKWTEEKIRQEIIDGGYETRFDLKKKNIHLYKAALGRNMLDEFFDPHKWTPEKIRQAIKDGGYVSRNDLKIKNPNLYRAALRNNMLDEFFDHFTPPKNREPIKWTLENIRQAIKDGNYASRVDLYSKNRGLYNAALKNKMLDDLFSKK